MPAPPAGSWSRMRVWVGAHAVDDFYQGLVPATVPFFVLERGYTYTGAAGLALAATVGSAVPQLLVGVLADRHRVRWLAPVGVSLAGIGAGLAGLAPSYPVVLALLLLSGLGVAMFHPPAGRDAAHAAAGSATAMSYFAAGGSVGFFLAPAIATPALAAHGLGATVLFIPPAVLTGYILLRHQRVRTPAPTCGLARSGSDRPGLFTALTTVAVIRSTISLGVITFVSLYWINHLGASSSLGGFALTVEFGGAVIGTLVGGRIADRIGMVRTVQLGNLLLVPALGALLVCTDEYLALPIIALVGIANNIPFAVLVKLGQDYLPSRPGTAAGVTLGLAVSAGGLFLPVLGSIADHHGPRGAFIVLTLIPVVAAATSLLLREPENVRTTHHD